MTAEQRNSVEHHRNLHRKIQQRFINKVRLEIIRLLGNKCSKCGFSDIRALEIDHVKGNGKAEREKFKSVIDNYRYILSKVETGSKEYQCLCANCNRIKMVENGECRKI
jgi:hypothetical protein